MNNNVQEIIENEIKKEKIISKLGTGKIFKDKDIFPDFDVLENDNTAKKGKNDSYPDNNYTDNYYNDDEYFIDKEIRDIKNHCIKQDLIKLKKRYKFVDEMEIKWIYYQYGEYYSSNKYLQKKYNINPFEETYMRNPDKQKFIIPSYENLPSMMDNTKIQSNYNIKSVNESSNISGTLYEILSKKPKNWTFNNNSSSNNNQKYNSLEGYRSIRKQLIFQAKAAWASRRYNDAKVILARANRYKEEINSLLINRKVEIFTKNNSNLVYNANEEFIDLHGLNFEESLMIVKRKVDDIQRRKRLVKVLNIITGKGHHSENKSAVLFPRLSEYFKSTRLNFSSHPDYGTLKVYF